MGDETTYGIGEGPTTNVSVSLHAGNIAAVRARVGKRGFSAYVDSAVQRQIERDNLAELTAEYEAEHGELPRAEVDKARTLLRGDGEHVGNVA